MPVLRRNCDDLEKCLLRRVSLSFLDYISDLAFNSIDVLRTNHFLEYRQKLVCSTESVTIFRLIGTVPW